ncbi:uncharacterized protein LOC133529463 isoform X1 [Cydia pomonella]|uniref:uncharacterized protein LOC133529463 isoform X1 n=2 Tax=Cydia pomonella TaxID=82600 RepID=UPI002ADE5AF9|nr:uncharacterized protein LOC133529463 isoform X1 [Cydia pomonella]
MSDISSSTILPSNIYEEELNDETTIDMSYKSLDTIPNINAKSVCVLYLQNNNISTLPDDFFPSLPSLMWLDMRNNKLTEIPKTIQEHPCLSHLLLQNNCLTSLPNELGTLVNLKLLQLNGNPLTYPPEEILQAGTSKIMSYLHNKYMDAIFTHSQSELSEDTASTSGVFPESIFSQKVRSYNSVIDQAQLVKSKTLSVKFNDKEDASETEEYYSKFKGKKCPRLAESRISFPPKQSAKYLRPLYAPSKQEQDAKMKRSYLKEMALKKHKDFLATSDKILQQRKNAELLRQWQRNYRDCKQLVSGTHNPSFPYDVSPEYMTLLSREDIEKDLPDKYRKKIARRSKPTIPRKGTSDVHLALRIKQLFDNLESIDLNGGSMTPRTEQKVLLNEIQKITEIKQKLMELSGANGRSVEAD